MLDPLGAALRWACRVYAASMPAWGAAAAAGGGSEGGGGAAAGGAAAGGGGAGSGGGGGGSGTPAAAVGGGAAEAGVPTPAAHPALRERLAFAMAEGCVFVVTVRVVRGCPRVRVCMCRMRGHAGNA